MSTCCLYYIIHHIKSYKSYIRPRVHVPPIGVDLRVFFPQTPPPLQVLHGIFKSILEFSERVLKFPVLKHKLMAVNCFFFIIIHSVWSQNAPMTIWAPTCRGERCGWSQSPPGSLRMKLHLQGRWTSSDSHVFISLWIISSCQRGERSEETD